MGDRILDWIERHFLKAIALAILALCLMLCGVVYSVAHAADVTVSWTQPLTNTDGSAIPASGAGSIAQNRVQWGTCSGAAFGTQIGVQTIPAATSYVVTALAPGTYCFRVYAINTYGQANVTDSNVATKVVPAPIPNPPVVAVPVIAGMLQTPVYSVTGSGSKSTLVGFADVGTACTGPVLFMYRKSAFREVPRTSVKMWGSTTLRLAAPCA